MGVFTGPELAYLTLEGERRLARVATVGPDGSIHVTPVGWSLADDATVVEISGHDFAGTKKFRDVRRTGRASLVVDDVLPPWRPRGVEIRGHAEAIDDGRPRIRIRPHRVVSWGLEEDGQPVPRSARDAG
ncbi:PPOX class F420-dependent oxidoreductase [Nocardiopsis sp. N85]|uniref:PPOX class F420-dependent oxidoreductase n=1 Tax=Nocardiopsis sp. N85 TaxID=3029400 RepID=UPI00237F6DEC|nr:PPOX class F420-dependent oxidoreductase [Nocardiopsis sp. N85]MDE3720750.1 PPOX class F420-dependent oxidoreductase [Nocardiopsis sp. N85]